jgi:hypothetical protein
LTMHFKKPPSCSRVAQSIVLATVAWWGLVPWAQAAEPPKSAKAGQKQQSGAGDFVSYQDGKLTLQGAGGPLVWNNIGDNFKTYERDEDGRATKPKETVETLSKLTPGMAVRVNVEKSEISFGVDEATHGAFVSYSDGRLTLIGRAEELGPGFTNKYGTTLKPQIDPKTPVFESIDGGPFQPAGTAEVLSSVKEGAIITLRGKNDRILSIQIGVPKKQ